MPQNGFIRDELSLRLLILYVLDLMQFPVDKSQLTDLVMCDDCIDYFTFCDVLAKLIDLDMVTLEDERYTISLKGKENCAVAYDSLPASVRGKCVVNTERMNLEIQRGQMVSAVVRPNDDGNGHTVELSLTDHGLSLLNTKLYSVTKEDGRKIADNFNRNAEKIYNGILKILLADYGQEN